MKDHRLIDERSLAFDRLIAEELQREPALVEKARANLSRWPQSTDRCSAPDLLEWQRLLEEPLPQLRAGLVSSLSDSPERLQSLARLDSAESA